MNSQSRRHHRIANAACVRHYLSPNHCRFTLAISPLPASFKPEPEPAPHNSPASCSHGGSSTEAESESESEGYYRCGTYAEHISNDQDRRTTRNRAIARAAREGAEQRTRVAD